jgi:hypothetical protein
MSAIFFELQLVRSPALVFGGAVVAALALLTHQLNYVSGHLL